jgi:hypothetical protein
MTAHFVSHPVTRVALIDGSMDGLRQVDSFGSIIGVRAAPLSDLDRLKSFTHSGYLAYLIDAPKLYTGHGQSDRKIVTGWATSPDFAIATSISSTPSTSASTS